MQNRHRTAEKIGFFQRQFFQEFYGFWQLRRAPQSSLAAKRTDFRRLRHGISMMVNCQKPVFCKGSLISPRTQCWFAELAKWMDYKAYYLYLRDLERVLDRWCAQLCPPSLGRLLHFTNHRTVKEDLHIRICLILGSVPIVLFCLSVIVLVELNRSTLLGSGKSFVKALKAYELILKRRFNLGENLAYVLIAYLNTITVFFCCYYQTFHLSFCSVLCLSLAQLYAHELEWRNPLLFSMTLHSNVLGYLWPCIPCTWLSK